MKLATLCYLRANGRTLMLHRIKKLNDMHAGKWNGLGGKFLPGETPEQCAIREVQEESGLTMIDPVWRGLLTFPAFDNIDDWYAFVFVCHTFTGELIDCNEGVLTWIDDAQLLDLNLWTGDRIFLQWLDYDGFFSGQFIYEQGELVQHHAHFYPPRPIERLSTPAQSFQPGYDPADDAYCWTCGGAVVKRHCKIVCQVCGFTRDCRDP
jgi:8-oxo-dGTP diphosphatase